MKKELNNFVLLDDIPKDKDFLLPKEMNGRYMVYVPKRSYNNKDVKWEIKEDVNGVYGPNGPFYSPTFDIRLPNFSDICPQSIYHSVTTYKEPPKPKSLFSNWQMFFRHSNNEIISLVIPLPSINVCIEALQTHEKPKISIMPKRAFDRITNRLNRHVPHHPTIYISYYEGKTLLYIHELQACLTFDTILTLNIYPGTNQM